MYCALVTTSAFKQIRGIIRNYLWGAKTDKHTRAKVIWAITVQPLTSGGLKVLDLAMLASALLTKLLVRGLSPGHAPWKTIVQHRASQTRLTKGAVNGLLIFIFSCNLGAPPYQPHLSGKRYSKLLQPCEGGWTRYLQPCSMKRCVNIYSNSLIKSSTGTPFGCEPMTQLHTWHKNKTFYLRDI